MPPYYKVGHAKFVFQEKFDKIRRRMRHKRCMGTNFEHHAGIFCHVTRAPKLAIFRSIRLQWPISVLSYANCGQNWCTLYVQCTFTSWPKFLFRVCPTFPETIWPGLLHNTIGCMEQFTS